METAAVKKLADSWRAERAERQTRRSLDPGDFEALAEAGFWQLSVPKGEGGGWVSVPESTRRVAEALRVLAAGDPSPALVSAMHPAVLAFWLANPEPTDAGWQEQRGAVFAATGAGARWGTVTSEPGSGGDISKTRAVAAPAAPAAVDADIPGRRYVVTGDKHFGSGTGMWSYMLTTAIPEGEDEPAAFFLDTRALRDGSSADGFQVIAEWDGVGMAATQSHAVRLDGCAAVRVEYPGAVEGLVLGAGAVNMCLFTGVVLGIVDEAVANATERLGPRAGGFRAYEQVEWSRAQMEYWLAAQAFEGMLRAVEAEDAGAALQACLRGKTAVAELAEQVLLRVTRVVGGGTFSRGSPFSAWFEDVRALGFLRPPWGLAFDGIFATSFALDAGAATGDRRGG